jgi:hypothetical protein
MKASIVASILVTLAAFLVGRQSALPQPELLAAPVAGPAQPSIPAQGRRTVPAPKTEVPLVFEGGTGSSGAARDLIAVTGSYGVGTSVLYVLDAKTRNLAVYEARGGSLNSRRLFLVGARRIDLDMQLLGYNDESEFGYEELEKRFKEREGKPPVVGEGPAPAKAEERPETPAGSGK